MQCVILAGGRGTRLGEHSGGRPKHLVDIAGHPFADLQLAYLARAGVDHVVYCIGHLGEQIRAHVGDGSAIGLRVSYVDEGADLRGTGGAIRLAFDLGLLESRFVVLYGDTLPALDLREVFRAAVSADLPGLMTVMHNEDRFDTSNATFDGRLVRYDKHNPGPDMAWIDYGVSVLTDGVAAMIPSGQVGDLADVFHELGERAELAGYPATERFHEIGTPESRAELVRLVQLGKVLAEPSPVDEPSSGWTLVCEPPDDAIKGTAR